MGRNFNQSEYVAVSTIFNLQEVFLYVTYWLKYFCIVIKTSRMLHRKITKHRQNWYIRAKPTNRKTTSKREWSEEMLALLVG